MNMQEAAERADSMLDATFKEIVPEVVWVHGTTTTHKCDVIRRRTVMTVVSEQRRGGFLGVVQRHWEQSGYTIKSVRPDREMPAIYAVSPDGFQIRVLFGYKGQAFLQVNTPCVEQSEVAEPTSKANGPTYPPSAEIPTPNVRSDFWSATEPLPSSAPSS
ncbi:hypothetical protein [Streptomyces sp. NPDC127114]|uniref:hypothetical protein n=1 Tax=Streptomyces sp. NPDC127114 TaxID=3345366 RepID=UPI003643F50A